MQWRAFHFVVRVLWEGPCVAYFFSGEVLIDQSIKETVEREEKDQ